MHGARTAFAMRGQAGQGRKEPRLGRAPERTPQGGDGSAEGKDFVAGSKSMGLQIRYDLWDRPKADRDNSRPISELGWHDDRGGVLRFLDDLHR